MLLPDFDHVGTFSFRNIKCFLDVRHCPKHLGCISDKDPCPHRAYSTPYSTPVYTTDNK